MRITSKVLGTLIAAVLLGAPAPAAAQYYFGQNQVEYRHLRWRVLETEHFLIYYYPEEQVPVHDAARMAERAYSRLSRILGHQFREKKPIILYASRQDFGQSNINGDLGEGVQGVTEPERQRIELPFTGDYASFEHVLTHEMVHQFQFDIFARGRAGENLQTLEAVNPPGWFMEGMAEYLSLGPNHTLTTMWIRSAVENGDLPTIKQMTDDPDKYFPYRYGEALWRYIGERWGDASIGEILQDVTTSGIDRGFERELGVTMNQLSDQWREATREQYLPQLATMQRARDVATPLLTPKISGGNIFVAPTLSPDGNTIAFLSNGSLKKGEVFIDVYLGNAHTGKRIKRLVATTTNPRFEELRLIAAQGAFSPDNSKYVFTAQTAGRDVLSIADVNTGHVVQLTKLPIDGATGPSYSPDGKHIVFSGVVGGISDLYMVDPDGKNLRHLTQDRYGDVQPNWSPDGTRIAFATDRGSTDLSDLKLGKMQIAVYDLRDGSITVIPGQAGLNINPVWSPDGSEIAYVTDRDGNPNVYIYDFASGQHLRVTNLQGGVSSFTEYSPAITWSRGTDRLAFTYYDNNDYTVWYLDHPKQYATAAPPVAGAALAAVTPTVTTPSMVPPAPVRDSTPGGGATSTYRAMTGARQSSVVTQAEARDSNTVSSVATLLADPHTGLPDTLTFKEYPYRIRFEPDYISGTSIGVSTGGGYGTMYGAGTALVFSDLTGDHQLAVGGGVYGRIQDAAFQTFYADLSHRWQWIAGAQQSVTYLPENATENQNADGTFTDQYSYVRYVFRSVELTAQYPLNRFMRFELGLQGMIIGRGITYENIDYDQYGDLYNVGLANGPDLGSLSYVAPSAAFVTDNTLWGLTGPISGRRMRFSAAPTVVGNLRFTNFLADYRRYDPVVFNTLTFATRVFFDATTGRDADLFPIYVGTPDFVRGYDQASYYGGYTCDAPLGASSIYANSCATTQLVGTRAAVVNEELRFPIIRRFDLGPLPIGLPPVDGMFFYDAGAAWYPGQSLSLSRPKVYDPNTQRYFLRSYGLGLRVNLFNLAVLRWDLAKPLDRVNNKFNWTFSLGASY